jgi:acyl-CoA hydrolase
MQQREVTLRFLAEPTDVNFGGKVHGGALISGSTSLTGSAAAGSAG